MSQLYPIFADVSGRKVLVVGGGHVAERKVEALLEAGGQVVLISPELTGRLADLGARSMIDCHQRRYEKGDLEGAWLVVAACDDADINERIFSDANEERIFCNVVDQPERCSFQVPAVVRRQALQIAISTGGASPALAKKIRVQLQKEFGECYVIFLETLEELRRHVKKKYPQDQKKRAAILEEFVNSQALDRLRQGETELYHQLLQESKRR